MTASPEVPGAQHCHSHTEESSKLSLQPDLHVLASASSLIQTLVAQQLLAAVVSRRWCTCIPDTMYLLAYSHLQPLLNLYAIGSTLLTCCGVELDYQSTHQHKKHLNPCCLCVHLLVFNQPSSSMHAMCIHAQWSLGCFVVVVFDT